MKIEGLDGFYVTFTNVIMSVITGNEYVIPEGTDCKKLVAFSKIHDIEPLLYYAAMKKENRERFDDEAYRELCKSYSVALAKDTAQKYEAEAIFAAFEKEKIGYMPQKGVLLKDLYPSSDMRSMGDIDVFVGKKNDERACDVMKSIGYKYTSHDRFETVFAKLPYVYVEIHNELMSDVIKEPYEYFKDPFSIAKQIAGSYRYAFPLEYEYAYLVAHTAKHYRNGGIGLRTIIDIGVFRRKFASGFDREILSRVLSETKLERFEKVVVSLCDALFGKKEFSEFDVKVLKYVLSSMTHGTVDNKYNNNFAGHKNLTAGKISTVFRLIFPCFDDMKRLFPILKKAPVLLPLMCVVRWFDRLFRRTGLVFYRFARVSEVNKDIVDSRAKFMKDSGFDK